MIFIIEPEIDFVTITVVVGSLYQKKWHIIGTAFSPIRRFFIIFLLQDPNLIFFLDMGCSFIQFSFESHSIYLHALYIDSMSFQTEKYRGLIYQSVL